MTRAVTLAGYVAVVVAAVALETVARRSRRVPTAAETLRMVLRQHGPHVLVLAGWLWLGWHLFVRVDWLSSG